MNYNMEVADARTIKIERESFSKKGKGAPVKKVKHTRQSVRKAKKCWWHLRFGYIATA